MLLELGQRPACAAGSALCLRGCRACLLRAIAPAFCPHSCWPPPVAFSAELL